MLTPILEPERVAQPSADCNGRPLEISPLVILAALEAVRILHQSDFKHKQHKLYGQNGGPVKARIRFAVRRSTFPNVANLVASSAHQPLEGPMSVRLLGPPCREAEGQQEIEMQKGFRWASCEMPTHLVPIIKLYFAMKIDLYVVCPIVSSVYRQERAF
ncbi:hypothetical protein E2320_007208 [Naja naja]|nr:hypothetical protein E2320_007208 [Naja naja]